MPRMRWSRRLTSTEAGQGNDREHALRTGNRPRDPRPAEHADEDVLWLRAVLWRPAERPRVSSVPGVTGCATGGQRTSDPLWVDDRLGAWLRDRTAFAVSSQELLLSR